MTARERIRIDGGGYRRDHLRALAQRVEVADREVRIIGAKSNLLQTLTAASGGKPATPGVRSSVLKWRMGWDSNPRWRRRHAGFQDRCLQPLGHPSKEAPITVRRRLTQGGGRIDQEPPRSFTEAEHARHGLSPACDLSKSDTRTDGGPRPSIGL